MPHAYKRRSGGGGESSQKFESAPPPPPFSPAPQNLTPFLHNLPKAHIYLTSLDTHPTSFKRRLFAVPLLLNIFLSALLLWRLQIALPTYLDLFLTTIGYQNAQTVDVKGSDLGTLLGVGASRMMLFMGDFVLVRFVGMWPWDFFVGKGRGGGGSPVGWRRWVYFRETEIVVRRSRRWDRSLFSTLEEKAAVDGGKVANEFLEEGSEGTVFRERVQPAVAEDWVRNKTGYLMMDKSWDLFFSAMVDAHELVDDETLTLEDFKNQVLVYSEKFGGWLIWQAWKELEVPVQEDPFSISKLKEADRLG